MDNMMSLSTQNNNGMAQFIAEDMANTIISFSLDTSEAKVMAYNAINSPDFKISDMINKTIAIADVVMVPVSLVSEETGEVEGAMRSIIIDENGNTYTATATGIFNSLKNIYLIYGGLHFEEPLQVVVQQVQTKRGNTLTLKIVG